MPKARWMTPSDSEAARLSVSKSPSEPSRGSPPAARKRLGFLLGPDEANDLVASRDQLRDHG